jgi:hypothetical protein
MTGQENLAVAARDRATAGEPPRTHQSAGWRRWTDVLMHRWPTALGIAVAALAAWDLEDGLEFAALTVLLALVYLGAAALDRRWSAWLVLLAGLPLTFLIPSTSGIAPSVVLLVAAPVFLALGVARGQLRRPGGLTLQAAGVLAFGSIVLVALSADPNIGGQLVALALIGHAAWDTYHYLRDRVVPRSYAEFCAVMDLLLGAAILFVT